MERKKIFSKKILFSIFIILVIGNIILIILNINYLKRKKTQSNYPFSQIVQPEFYNSPCPDVNMVNIHGKKIRLFDLKGDVILIQFTGFQNFELPYLHYLEHLYKSFEYEGMHLFFIYHKRRENTELMNEFIPLSVPIIEDDGSISSEFSSRANDIVIIGRDLKIKFKSNQLNNRAIFNQSIRLLYENEDFRFINLSDMELGSLIKRISYLNIKNNEMEKLEQKINKKPSLINIYISTCFSCQEHARVRLMKDLSAKHKGDIVFLFGRGNNFDSVKQFSYRFELENFTVGIIQPAEDLYEEDYYRIFRFDVDPRIIILGENGEISYKEEPKDQRKINLDFLLKRIK